MPAGQWSVSRSIFPAALVALATATACGPAQRATIAPPDSGPMEPGDASNMLADSGLPPDASVTVSDAGPQNLSCGAVAVCSEACGSNTGCRDQCYAEGTPQAQNLARALDTCLDALCSPTGVCASASASCSMCLGAALVNGCAVLYGVCEGDMSGAPPDGGMTTLPDGGMLPGDGGVSPGDGGLSPGDGGVLPGDGGSSAGDGGFTPGDGGLPGPDGGLPAGVDTCFEVSLCTNGCGSQYCVQHCVSLGTPAAQMEYNDFVNCIGQSCPSTDGGICDYSAPHYDANACSNCYTKAESTGGPCFADTVSCEGVQCATQSTCDGSPAPKCDPSIGYCVQCVTSSDCGAGEACIDYTCQPTGTLSCIGIYDCLYGCADSDCTQGCIAGGTPTGKTDYLGYANCQNVVCPNTDGGICDAPTLGQESGACDNCIQNAQNGICLAQIEACISNCVTSADCVYDPSKPACDTETATCVQCARTADCPSGQICASNVCIRTCETTQNCPSDQTCMNGICVAAPCHSDADCAGTTSTPHCDVATGVCGP